MPGTVAINLELNTQNAEQGLNNFMGKANSMISSSGTPSMTGNPSTPPMSGVEGSTVLNGGESQQVDLLNRQLEAHKISNDFLKKIYEFMIQKNGGGLGGNGNNSNNGNLPSTNHNGTFSGYNGARNVINGVSNVALAAERGDVAGATFGLGNMAIQGLESGSKMASAGGMAALAKGLAGGAVVGLAAMAIGKGLEEMSKQYEGNLSGTEEAMRSFGGSSLDYGKNGYKNNADLAQSMLNLVSNKGFIQGTGMTNAEFMSSWSNMAKYGYTPGLEGELSDFNAARATQLASYMSHVTGADVGTIQNLYGTAYRYNGETADSVARSVYAATNVQGLNDRQAPELISAITRAMEEGVSKGFVKSSKDIALELSFFGSMTDNETWKGSAGAQKYEQISNGLANATSLSNTSQVLAYRGMRNFLADQNVQSLLDASGKDTFIEGEDELNTFAMMERGASAGALKSIHNQMKGAYGDDKWGIIESYRQLNGLNYNGAMQLYNLMEKNPDMDETTLQSKINDIKADKNNQSDSTKMQDAMNDINLAVSNLGKNVYEVKMESMGQIGKDVSMIASFITKDAYSKLVSGRTQGFFDTNGGAAYEEKGIKNRFDKTLGEMFKNPDTMDSARSITSLLGSFSDEEISYANQHNLLNEFDPSSPDAVEKLMKIKQQVKGKSSAYNTFIKNSGIFWSGDESTYEPENELKDLLDTAGLNGSLQHLSQSQQNRLDWATSLMTSNRYEGGTEAVIQVLKEILEEQRKPRELEYAK